MNKSANKYPYFNMIFLSVFITGAISGYLTELFYTKLISKKMWQNPGFLKGPYLPQYGFGAAIIYLVCSLNIGFAGRFFIFLILLSSLEYITGYIFIKKLGYKFWDYSMRKFNLSGLICPLFAFVWASIGAIFYYTLYPLFQYGINIWFISASLLIFIIMAIDFIITVYRLIKKISRAKRT